MHSLVLRVLDHRDNISRISISAISLIGSTSKTDLPKYPEKRFLKCPACHHHDFREGIAINHYECDGCGTGFQIWHA